MYVLVPYTSCISSTVRTGTGIPYNIMCTTSCTARMHLYNMAALAWSVLPLHTTAVPPIWPYFEVWPYGHKLIWGERQFFWINGSIRFSSISPFSYKSCIPGTRYEIRHTIMHIKIVFRRLKDGRMVVAGGHPNVAVECAVARSQLRYLAPFFTDSLPLFHAKQTNTLAF